MKSTLRNIISLLAVGATLACVNHAFADEIDYSNSVNSVINFQGNGTFNFQNNQTAGGDVFQITSSGAAANLTGNITGTYTIGTVNHITTNYAWAAVTGSGQFIVHDGASNDLTGTLQWVNIQESGTAGSLNIAGQLNLTNITYSGLNPILLSFANGHSATNALSFQFHSTTSLDDLVGPTQHQTSFSGSVSAPDGGTTIMLLGFALTGLALVRRRRQTAA
ncbi:MAG TPA: VPDSG-CTERM sorting domain-containing protein [Opitutaceae bacterium]|nr:VPDSG-CTERM sorting domain-containing protein [Opitutaceae bacterium]